MPTLRQAIKRLRIQGILPPSGTVSVKDLNHQFQPIKRGSTRSLLLTMLASYVDQGGGSTHPYYRRSRPMHQQVNDFADDLTHINLTKAHMEPYPVADDQIEKANGLFDKRAAAAVWATYPEPIESFPSIPDDQLWESKLYDVGALLPGIVIIPQARCLGLMAIPDYFPDLKNARSLYDFVSKAILGANPGYCGTFGPRVDAATDLPDASEGNYDMSQMYMLQIAYRYYDELPEAREFLITVLLATGLIHRPRLDDIVTSGGAPNDWSRAGFVSPAGDKFRIGETENHIIMIHTVRYLTNQLLYQRDHDPNHDNRRNGSDDAPSCTDLMLYLLRNILRDDFSEYNAKPYQTETRYALLNLCSYAYDHEVRLAARMVLDYISAHIAISSNDLRRMVPFRRINKDKNVTRDDLGFMDVGLLETSIGADPMAQHFAILAGNTRIYGQDSLYHPPWKIFTGESDGNDAVMYALSDYRLPPSIHDLFLNDLHRRFFQRLHRTSQDDPEVTGRNCDNFEIFAGSPSYLISAGGEFARWAIDPGPVEISPKLRRKNDQQLGVAVPTSFMPTTRLKADVPPLLNCGNPSSATDLIQFGSFSDIEFFFNYGVAPDFACGHRVRLPLWCQLAIDINRHQNPNQDYGRFEFVDRGSGGEGPGFFLALFRDGNMAVMEAFDTWLFPEMNFEVFKRTVHDLNSELLIRGLHSGVADEYKTINGDVVHFIIWDGTDEAYPEYGAKILSLDYGGREPMDNAGDAGNVSGPFLNGTILNSKEDGVVEISNPSFGTKGTTIILDMNDQWHPKRTSETDSKIDEVEEAGPTSEVWVNFGWTGPSEGDFFRPFNTITAAAIAVDDGGVIKIMPGWTTEKPSFPRKKRIRLVAPIGGVTIGVR